MPNFTERTTVFIAVAAVLFACIDEAFSAGLFHHGVLVEFLPIRTHIAGLWHIFYIHLPLCPIPWVYHSAPVPLGASKAFLAPAELFGGGAERAHYFNRFFVLPLIVSLRFQTAPGIHHSLAVLGDPDCLSGNVWLVLGLLQFPCWAYSPCDTTSFYQNLRLSEKALVFKKAM